MNVIKIATFRKNVTLLRIYRLLLIIVVSVLFLATGIGVLVFLIAGKSALTKVRACCTMWWARSMCCILGIRIEKSGETEERRGSFTVCNHISYLDIFVVGSVRPSGFVAKQDVRSWPLAGWLASLADTVFINRESTRAAIEAMRMMEQKIDSGVNVVIFPEGTTSDGLVIKPFKSTLFNLPACRNITVIPVSIRYTGIDGKVMPQDRLGEIAWYGDMQLVPHLWHVLGLKSIEATLHFNPSISPVSESLPLPAARKRLCSLSHESIESGFALADRSN